MAKNPSGRDDSLDGMSAEVDRLLKQLPGADPTLKGSAPLSPPLGGRPPGLAPVTAGGSAVKSAPRESTPRDRLGAWLKVGLSAAAGALMTQWPYAHSCGLGLYLYLGSVLAVTVAGGWASVASWKHRMAVAHVLSLGVVLWGLILAAAQILPRIGYAAAAAGWRCL
jgi:hypothetical protein